jgi:hypothetical protein
MREAKDGPSFIKEATELGLNSKFSLKKTKSA